MNGNKLIADLDQTAATLRDCRHTLLRTVATARKREWWLDYRKLRTLVCWIITECRDTDEARARVDEAMSKPWNFRAEYVIAECRNRDSKP